jgi:two-component system sensor histidine kinase BaeS
MARFGLRTRLLVGTILVAASAVAATAWLSVQGTARSIADQQKSLRSVYPGAYSGLVDYAATHTDWQSVGPVLASLANFAGVRIVVTPVGEQPIQSSAAPSGSHQVTQPSVAIDPLTIDNALAMTHFPDGIDPHVVGPFLLSTQEHADLEALVEDGAVCLRQHGVNANIAEVETGRPYLRITQASVPQLCQARMNSLVGFQDSEKIAPTSTEKAALAQLSALMKTCADAAGKVDLGLDGRGQVTLRTAGGDPRGAKCLADARRQLLRPYVAPAAFMQVTVDGHATEADVGLSSAGALRIAGVAAIVLALTVGIAMLLAGRIIRPVRVLTEATRRMRAGDATVRAQVGARWEISELAAAFNEMAEHAAHTEQQRKDLVSDVSHELRTPLGTLRGWLVAAQDGVAALDPELVSSLLEETLLLQHLVDDLGDLALADAGQLRLEPVELNLGALLRHVAAAGGGRATVVADQNLLLVVDPIRLRQVVGNLVANAVRHTPPDGQITLSARSDGQDVLIEVADSGTGIPPEDLPHVFDRFWRADKSRSRRTGGSGLGLAIVRQLVEAHGGEISAASTPGAGTTFTLRFPSVGQPHIVAAGGHGAQ